MTGMPTIGTAALAARAVEQTAWLAHRITAGLSYRVCPPRRVLARRPYPELVFQGEGHSRVVWRAGDVVYKVTKNRALWPDCSERAATANRTEWQTVAELWPADTGWPATLWTDQVLAAPWIKPLFCQAHPRAVPGCNGDHSWRRVSALFDRLPLARLAAIPNHDRHPGNFGWYAGRLVNVDLQDAGRCLSGPCACQA